MSVTIGFDASRVDDAAEFQLGTVAEAGNEIYFYAQADAAVGQYDVVALRGNCQAKKITTTIGGRNNIAVAQVAVANDKYAWFCIAGHARVNVAASCAPGRLYTTSTGGRLDDSATAGFVVGIEVTTARGSSAGDAPAYIAPYPHTVV